MTLPIPNLDDSPYEFLLSGALKALPNRAPDWTEYNASDPGVTLVELMAWLTEQQMYYTNRLRQDHYRKFLKLLGYTPQRAQPARLRIALDFPELEAQEGETTPVYVPQGTRFQSGQRYFESLSGCFSPTPKIVSMFRRTQSEQVDCLHLNSILPFGESASGQQEFTIGLDRVPPKSMPLKLDLDLAAGDPPSQKEFSQAPNHNAEVAWHYRVAGGWQPLQTLTDQTRQLSWSGHLCFAVPQNWEPVDDLSSAGKAYVLQLRLVRPGFDQAPEITGLGFNQTTLVEKKTLVLQQRITLQERKVGDSPLLRHGWRWLSQKRADGLWHDLPQEDFQLKEEEGGSLSLELSQLQGDGSLQIMSANGHTLQLGEGNGKANQRLRIQGKRGFGPTPRIVSRGDGQERDWRPVANWSETGPTDAHFQWDSDEWFVFGDGQRGRIPMPGELLFQINPDDRFTVLGTGTGLANQAFYLPDEGIVKIGIQSRLNGEGWQDWERVEDFYGSNCQDAHFLLDPGEQQVRFGDGLRGKVPRMGEILRLVSLQTEKIYSELPGQELQLQTTETPSCRVQIKAHWPGSTGETLPQTINRVQRELLEPSRAITLSDCEALALNTPGIQLAAARAFRTEQESGPSLAGPRLAVAILPRTHYPKHQPRPVPGKRMLELVRLQMERHRLLGAPIVVVPVAYVKFGVTLSVLFQARRDPGNIQNKIRQTLLNHFRVPAGNSRPEQAREAMGRTVGPFQVHGLLDEIKEIKAVSGITIVAEPGPQWQIREGVLECRPHIIPWCDESMITIRGNTGEGGPT